MRKGWEIKKLKEVCEKITDGTHQTPKYFDDGYIFLSSGNVTTGTINWDKIKYIDEEQHLEMQKRVSPKLNDILLAKNGTTGVAAMVDREVDFDIYVSLALLRPLEVITPHYLLYFINSPLAKAQFNSRLKGAGVPNLHLTEIREVEIPFPKDKKQQQRIVSILDEAFSSIEQAKENLQRNLQYAKELFQSELNSIFTNKGEGWKENTLGKICEKIQIGPFGTQVHKEDYQQEGIPIINPKHIKYNSLNAGEMISEEKANSLPQYILRKGDIIMARRGEMGRVALIDDKSDGWFCGTGSLIIRLGRDYNSNLYVWLFSNRMIVEQLNEQSVGATMSNLNSTIINNLKIPEIPFLQQQKIVQQLEKLSTETKRLEEMYQQKLDALEELKKSILQKAFSGELSN